MQKKLQLSGTKYRFSIICTDGVFAKNAKETLVIVLCELYIFIKGSGHFAPF